MSEHYAETDPWAEVPEAMDAPTSGVPDPYRDSDDDFDYEGYYNANITAAAASIGHPDLENEIAYFGIGDLRGEQMTPPLVEAIEIFQKGRSEFDELSPEQRTPALEEQRTAVEAEARSAVREAREQLGIPGRREISGSYGLSRGARHLDEGRRVVPATPLFDGSLKARQKEVSETAGRRSAGRVKALLGKIRTTEKKNDVGWDDSNSTRGREQARDRDHGRGR